MINAKDLRIGNYCQDELTKEILIVDDIISNEKGKHNVAFNLLNENKYPLPKGWCGVYIPLTEEWLVNKTDFKLMPVTEYTIDTFEYKGFKLWQRYRGEFLYFVNDTWIKIEYVHRLQNAFQSTSLTGEELTIK